MSCSPHPFAFFSLTECVFVSKLSSYHYETGLAARPFERVDACEGLA